MRGGSRCSSWSVFCAGCWDSPDSCADLTQFVRHISDSLNETGAGAFWVTCRVSAALTHRQEFGVWQRLSAQALRRWRGVSIPVLIYSSGAFTGDSSSFFTFVHFYIFMLNELFLDSEIKQDLPELNIYHLMVAFYLVFISYLNSSEWTEREHLTEE